MSRCTGQAYLSTAHGTKNPHKRVELYQKILSLYLKKTEHLSVAGGGPACSQQFRDLLETSYPKLFSRLLETVSSKRSLSIHYLWRYLFPTPVCHECEQPFTKFGAFCSEVCKNMHRYGVSNPMQSQEIRDRGIETNLKKRGVEYASQCHEVKKKKIATNRRVRGVDNPSQSQDVKNQKAMTNMSRRGVDNPMRDPSVVAAMGDAYEQKYGVRHSMQNPDVQEAARASNRRARGVDYAMQSPEVRAKRVESCRQKYGVDHHFQIASILEKAQRSAYTIKSYTYKDRVFEAQSSYEAFIFAKLADKYGVGQVLTQYDKGFPSYAFQEMRTHPDLYVESLNLFIEVKSEWTLLGNDKNGCLEHNRRKAERADVSGNKERWVVAYPAKDYYTLLPRRWYKWSPKYLKKWLSRQ